jgi:hypothetical protein
LHAELLVPNTAQQLAAFARRVPVLWRALLYLLFCLEAWRLASMDELK